MAAFRYLRRTGRRYVFRRRVPAGIRSRLRRAEVVKGPGPCTFTEAGRRARRLAAAADELFATVERDHTLTPDQVDALARDYFERLVCADERRLCRFRPEDEADVRREVERTRREREGYRELLRINDWEVAGEVVDRLLAEAGLRAAVGATAYRDLCRKAFRALTEAARLQLAKLHGGYGVEPRDPLFRQRSRPTTQAEPERPASRTVEAAPRLGELVAAHLEAMARAWTRQTRHQNAATLRLFVEHVGDRPVDGIARRDVSAFLEALARLPSKYGQQRPFRGKTLAEMLALAAAAPPGPRLSRKTLSRTRR